MASNFQCLHSRKARIRHALQTRILFCVCTVLMILFAVKGIHSWPSRVKQISILLVCALPVVMVFLGSYPKWVRLRRIPMVMVWVLLVTGLGVASSLFSENQWATFKSTILFVASGPFILVATRYWLDSWKNTNAFLWLTAFASLGLGVFGIIQYAVSGSINLFSDNPLPAGSMLVLLSVGPWILLRRNPAAHEKRGLLLTLGLSGIVVVLLAKKGPVLGFLAVLVFQALFINKKYRKGLLAFLIIAICLFSFSPGVYSKYKDLLKPGSSVGFRAENYFFAYHVLKKSPVWGMGFKSNLVDHLKDYDLKVLDRFSMREYWLYMRMHNTFENIFISMLIELGLLFAVVYFGGLFYIFYAFLKQFKKGDRGSNEGMLVISVLIGFAAISMTFDTLRFPDLNWMFHSLLGFLMSRRIASTPEPS